MNESVEKWIKSLPEDKQQRIQLIQNEVNDIGYQLKFNEFYSMNNNISIYFMTILLNPQIVLKRIEEKRMPRLEVLNIADFEEMLQMSQGRRQKYYQYLCSSQDSSSNDAVFILFKKQYTKIHFMFNVLLGFFFLGEETHTRKSF